MTPSKIVSERGCGPYGISDADYTVSNARAGGRPRAERLGMFRLAARAHGKPPYGRHADVTQGSLRSHTAIAWG